jgi:hypothetical protein
MNCNSLIFMGMHLPWYASGLTKKAFIFPIRHGGKSPGALTSERNGNYRHSYYTAEAIAERRRLSAAFREC